MKTILINWYYHRYDLTEYLLQFASDTRLVFLYKQFDEEEQAYVVGKKNISVIYWSNYSSPYAMLKAVAPDVVVFADLESFNQIALNIAARNKGIKTFVLQHGIRGGYEIDEALSVNSTLPGKMEFSSTSKWSMKFLVNSLQLKNLPYLPSLLKFIYSRKKTDLTTALFHNKFELRRADYYLEFSEDNAGYHRKRDGIPENRFIITGNPLFDDYFDYLNNHNKTGGNYCLLIDCPFTEANFYQDNGFTATTKNQYLQKLGKWSEVNGLHLKVKLHPLSYETTGLYQSPTIEYVKDADLKILIADAAAVFFVHFSTVAPVILTYKPSVYFHSTLQQHKTEFNKLGITEVSLFDFDETQKNLFEKAVQLPLKAVQPHLYSTDGKAAQRIKNALLTRHENP